MPVRRRMRCTASGGFIRAARRYAEAIAAYRQALAMDAGHDVADAQNGLGVIYAEQGRYDEAVKAFQAAIAASLRAAYLQNNLGYVLLLQGSNGKAVEVLEEARRLSLAGNAKVRDNLVGYERLIEQRKAQRPVQLDPETAVAVEAEEIGAGVSRGSYGTGFRRQACHGRPCRLRAASIRRRSGRCSDEAWGRLGSTRRDSPLRARVGCAAHALTNASAGHEVRVAGSPTTIEASGSATSRKIRQSSSAGARGLKLEVSNGNGGRGDGGAGCRLSRKLRCLDRTADE